MTRALQRSAGDADIKDTQTDILQLKNKVESLQGESDTSSDAERRLAGCLGGASFSGGICVALCVYV